jgi:hypothetical protein
MVQSFARVPFEFPTWAMGKEGEENASSFPLRLPAAQLGGGSGGLLHTPHSQPVPKCGAGFLPSSAPLLRPLLRTRSTS